MKKIALISVASMAFISILVASPAFAGDECCKGEEVVVIKSCVDAAEDCIMHLCSAGQEENVVKVKVKKSGKRSAYLGIYMEDLSKKLKEKYEYPEKHGVLITEIVEDSPAEEAGLDEDDIIYLFDGEEVDDANGLALLVKGREPGKEVEIVFYRDGEKKKIDVTLDENPFQFYTYKYDDIGECAEEIGKYAGRLGKSVGYYVRSAFGMKGRLGVELLELDEDLAGYFDVKEDEGVLVIKVIEDSPAEKVGIKAGDVIVAVQGEGVTDIDDVMDELSDIDIEEEKEVEIEVVRKGTRKTFKLDEEDLDEDFFYWTPKGHNYRIEIPEMERIEVPEIRIEKVELEKTIKELEKKLKEMEERLKELEKD